MRKKWTTVCVTKETLEKLERLQDTTQLRSKDELILWLMGDLPALPDFPTFLARMKEAQKTES